MPRSQLLLPAKRTTDLVDRNVEILWRWSQLWWAHEKACASQGLFVRQMGDHNFPHHFVLWLGFQLPTSPFCERLLQAPLVSTAPRLMSALPACLPEYSTLLFLCLLFIHRAPHIKQASRQIHSSQEKAFSRHTVEAPGWAQPDQLLIPLHLHCIVPYLNFTLKRNHTCGGGKSPKGRYVFVFKREFIIYLSWKRPYVPFQQRKKEKTDQKHRSKRRKGISRGRRGGGGDKR